MSAIVKGDPSAQLVAIFPNYNSETRIYVETHEYRGTQEAIRGLELQFQQRGLSYRITHDGPVWTMQVDVPQQSVNELIDRWEIFTESTEKSLFEIPEAIQEAELWNAGILVGDSAYKKIVESAVDTRDTEIESQGNWPVAFNIIKHLRSGVTGWQHDLVVLRRTRQIERYAASGFRMTLDGGLFIYNTGQLGVPNDVGFNLPITPALDPSVTVYRWGWRKRSQRIEAVGQYVEQTVELVFAPWSTLAYTTATSDLIW